ncbi:type II secretion system protein M [Psychromonas hadalis]|uniref:type II secretion system protein M n=1 Tax=Psychromonas hadalis TaxID=211669 RepID=UPI0003B60336|nr:type II secretion system protein M [Psychromonas hadalis]
MEQFKAWWESITPREQQLAMISAVVLGIAILYWGIWSPLTNQLADSQKQLVRAESTLNWSKEKATVLLDSGVGKPPVRGGNLTQIINSSAQKHGIIFSRIVNKKGKMEVWITDVEFNRFIKWLTSLSNKQGVSVLNADLGRTERSGYIKVNRLLLSQ